jgi:hypothetical protein
MTLEEISKKEVWKSKKTNWGILLTILGIHTMALVKVIINRNNSSLSVGITIISLFLLFNLKSARYYNRPPKYITWIFLYSALTIILSLFYSFEADHSTSEIPFGIVYQGCCFVQILLLWNCKNVDFEHLKSILFWYTGFLGVVTIILILRDPSLAKGVYFISGLNNQEGEMIITRASPGSIGAYVVLSSLAYIKQKNKAEQILRYIFLGVGILITLITNRRTIVGTIVIVLFLHLFELFIKRENQSIVFTRIVIILFCFIFLIVVLPFSNNYFIDLIRKSIESLSNAVGNLLGLYNKYDMSANLRRVAMEKILHEFYSAPLSKQLFGHGYGSMWIDIPFLQSFWELGILGGVFFSIIKIIVPFSFLLKRTEEPLLLFLRYCLVIRLIEDFASGTCYGTFFIIVLYVFVRDNMSLLQKTDALNENNKSKMK